MLFINKQAIADMYIHSKTIKQIKNSINFLIFNEAIIAYHVLNKLVKSSVLS